MPGKSPPHDVKSTPTDLKADSVMIYPHGMVRMRVGSKYITCYPTRDKLLQIATDALIAAREKLRAERPADPPPPYETCSACNGTGDRAAAGDGCYVCGGKGLVRTVRPISRQRNPLRTKPVLCATCGGKGLLPLDGGFAPCPKCGGEGTAP